MFAGFQGFGHLPLYRAERWCNRQGWRAPCAGSVWKSCFVWINCFSLLDSTTESDMFSFIYPFAYLFIRMFFVYIHVYVYLLFTCIYIILLFIFNLFLFMGSRDSAVGIATGYGLDDWEVGVRVPVGYRIITSPCRPDRLWGPPNLLYNGYR
jgi:hypothetical protein